jgi:DNA-binding beta-propeller fold protein YncE
MPTAQPRIRRLALVGGTIVAVAGCGAEKDSGPPSSEPGPPRVAQVRASVDVGRVPRAVAVGDGVVWVADQAGLLLRLDARSRQLTGRPIPVGTAPFAVAIGEGAVWVAGADGLVRSIDPRSGRLLGRPTRVPGASGLAVGEDGVWVTSRTAGTVTRIDPQSLTTDPPIPVGAGPADVALAGGSVWVANAADGSVSRIDPGSSTASPPVGLGGTGVPALASGPEGLWAVRAVGPAGDRLEVVRLDPESARATGEPVPVRGGIPVDLAVGGGSVWATDVGGVRPGRRARPGSVTRIDPSGGTVGSSLRVGDAPSAIAVGAGAVWVASAGAGTVTPITLAP